MALNDNQLLRYSKHLTLKSMNIEQQEKICNAHVLVVGAGGLGCAALPYLVAAGVGEVTIMDQDIVKLSNLHRQILHTQHDLEKPKVLSAKAALEALNPDCKINALNHFFNEDDADLLGNMDVVVDCSDNLTTRNLLNQHCFEEGVPLVSGSAIRFEGQLITLDMKSGNACYHCLSHLISNEQLNCAQSGVFSPIVGVVGSLQATESLKLLAGIGSPHVNKLLLIDGFTMDFQQIRIKPNPNCEVCSTADF